MLDAVLITEDIRTAMRHFGHQPLTGAQVQWGLEHLTLTAASLKELGAEGLLPPITLSCRDHEGGASVKFQQWDGTQWKAITDWIARTRRWCGPWWRRQRRSMHRRRASCCGTAHRRVPPTRAHGACLHTRAAPNTYEGSPCQETNDPYERFFAFFPLSGFWVPASSAISLVL